MHEEIDRPKGWQLLMNGRVFHLDPVDPEEIFIEDIAGALSKMCRWGGHIRAFYSVAQHCVLASRLTNAEFALAALLHDASEAYIGDMIRPLKRIMPNFEVIEDRIMNAVSVKFGFEWPMPAEVIAADNALLTTEHGTLRGYQNPKVWNPTTDIKVPKIKPWTPAKAEREFLKRFKELRGQQEQQADLFGFKDALRRALIGYDEAISQP